MIPDMYLVPHTNSEEAAGRTIWESSNLERRDSTELNLDDVSLNSNSEHKHEILHDDSDESDYESDNEEDETEGRTKKMFSGLKHKALPQDKKKSVSTAATTNKRRGGRTSMQQMQDLMHIPHGRQSIVSVDQNIANKTKSFHASEGSAIFSLCPMTPCIKPSREGDILGVIAIVILGGNF